MSGIGFIRLTNKHLLFDRLVDVNPDHDLVAELYPQLIMAAGDKVSPIDLAVRVITCTSEAVKRVPKCEALANTLRPAFVIRRTAAIWIGVILPRPGAG